MKKLTDIRHRFDHLVWVAILPALLLAVPPAAWCKPLYPFSARWAQAPDGERVRLTLRVEAAIPLPRVAVAVTAGAGMALDGATAWTGPMTAGEVRELVLWAPASAKGRVTAVVTVTTASNMQLSAGTAIDVPQPDPIPPPPARRDEPAGGPAPEVREFVVE